MGRVLANNQEGLHEQSAKFRLAHKRSRNKDQSDIQPASSGSVGYLSHAQNGPYFFLFAFLRGRGIAG
jgi:hypothetical protein